MAAATSEKPTTVNGHVREDSEPGGAGLLRQAFRGHPAGVAIITVDAGARPAGFTATSIASVSADPPMVSFSIASTSSSWPHVRDAGTAVINFLHADQEELARTFATSGIDRFAASTNWTRLPTGEPLLDGVAGWLRVRLEEPIAAGQARLLLGTVVEGRVESGDSPLIYHDGRFLHLPMRNPATTPEEWLRNAAPFSFWGAAE
ncbi:flavin reductase family protein [Streptomyces ipomoeae]|uniref:flavin reductase family protein n=1 Tax=Streptomyces ipomoeae TaxID=103232 RepID=UPI0015F00566|nr:flavin reductase family protein [Streptomyces ipomoeae]MDX2937767.1 flavin reductase family protein [Streptomyces ipomoeae]